MSRRLNKSATAAVMMVCAFLIVSCASAPPVLGGKDAGPSRAKKAPAEPITAEFAGAWDETEIRIDHGNPQDLEDGIVMANFRCVWTDGQNAGVAYPEQFVSSDTGEEVAMDFMRDFGGKIAEGTYDVLVEIDGRCEGGWLRNVPLEGEKELEVIIDLNACQFALPFDTYGEVVVYPSGTHDDFSSRNMLDAIPDDLAITWYNQENRGIWAVAPSGTFDLRVTYADETVEWLEDYELPANARVTEL